MSITKVQCRNCRYYQITWDQDKPYGCQKLGFKTKIHPADYILSVSGESCHSFEDKYTYLRNLDGKRF